MDTQRFDSLTSNFAATSTRRGALRFLAATAFGAGSVALYRHDDASAKRKGGKKHKRPYRGGTTQPAPGKGLHEICMPGQDVCGAGLQCGAPTTRHTCSSTVDGVDAWCCVPPGGRCSECDCCGNYYCAYDDDNNPTCVPNPEM